MKKLLLIATLALAGQQLRGDEPRLDLFAMLGVAPDCDGNAIETTYELRMDYGPPLAGMDGYAVDIYGYGQVIKRIANFLMSDSCRSAYYKHWSALKDARAAMINPFAVHPNFHTEHGIVEVERALTFLESSLREKLALSCAHFKSVDSKSALAGGSSHRTSPPIAIPQSPVMDRKRKELAISPDS